MHRRRFFGALLAPLVARLIPCRDRGPAVGAINRASFKFWRNQDGVLEYAMNTKGVTATQLEGIRSAISEAEARGEPWRL